MTKTKIFNIISACLMILLLVMQFMPYWQSGEQAGSTSIHGYVWFPEKHQDLTREIQSQTNDPDFQVGSIVLMPCLELVLCAAGAVFGFIRSSQKRTMLFPAAAGAIGIWGYLKPAYRLGASWTLHITVSVLLLAAAIIFYGALALHIKKSKEA